MAFDMEKLQAYAAQKEMIEKTFSPEKAATMLQELEKEFTLGMTPTPTQEQPVVEQPQQSGGVNIGYQPVPSEFQGDGNQPKYNEEILSRGIHSGKTHDMVAAWREAGKAVNDGKEVRHIL